jgi:hypothetical protein
MPESYPADALGYAYSGSFALAVKRLKMKDEEATDTCQSEVVNAH